MFRHKGWYYIVFFIKYGRNGVICPRSIAAMAAIDEALDVNKDGHVSKHDLMKVLQSKGNTITVIGSSFTVVKSDSLVKII